MRMQVPPEGLPGVPSIEQFELPELQAASHLLAAEMEAVRRGMGHSDVPPAEYDAAWRAVTADIIWLPAARQYGRAAAASVQERVASLQVR